MWIAYQRARIHIPIPCWIPLIVILLAFYVVSLRNAAKKCLMARFCQNWLDSTFCWDISSWQSCVGTCSMHRWFFKWGESNTSVDARDNTNGIKNFSRTTVKSDPLNCFPSQRILGKSCPKILQTQLKLQKNIYLRILP